MSFPRKVKLFRPWANAMVEGATVGEPDYGKKTSRIGSTATVRQTGRKRRRRKRRRRRMNNAKEK